MIITDMAKVKRKKVESDFRINPECEELYADLEKNHLQLSIYRG